MSWSTVFLTCLTCLISPSFSWCDYRAAIGPFESRSWRLVSFKNNTFAYSGTDILSNEVSIWSQSVDLWYVAVCILYMLYFHVLYDLVYGYISE